MKKIIIAMAVTSSAMAAEPTMQEEMVNKMYDNQFETMSQGLTPEQRAVLKESLEKAKQMAKEFAALSPEEQKRKQAETIKKLTDQKNKPPVAVQNISPEEKQMLELMIKNSNSSIAELKDPKSEASRKMRIATGEESDKTIDEIIDSPKPTATEIYYAAMTIGKSEIIIEGAEDKLIKLSKFPNNDAQTHIAIAFALAVTKSPVPRAESIFLSIVLSPKNNPETISRMLSSFYTSPRNKLATPETIKLIMNSGRANSDSLVTLAQMIIGSSSSFMQKIPLLESLLAHPSADKFALRYIAVALKFSASTIPEAEKIYLKIINSPLMDKVSLEMVKESLSKDNNIKSDKTPLISQIDLRMKTFPK